LNYPFRVPTLLIVTWRGQPGVKDEPQHEQMGRIMHQLLDTLEIPWLPFPQNENEIAGVMRKADASMVERQQPFALVMAKDSIEEQELASAAAPDRLNTDLRQNFSANERLTRTEALEVILEGLSGNEATIATTGKTGRELFTIADRPNHLYVVGGMGTASAIGFGVAHALPRQPVVVIDGDGAALMKMGSLGTIGFYRPGNFLHIILDNEVHDSTGGQQTVSSTVRFAEVAAAANYRNAWAVDRRLDIAEAVKELRQRPGPSLLHIKIKKGSPEKLGRPTVKPHEVRERFSHFLRSNLSTTP
jgi:phosphonopyruvate decarboxylase